MNLIDVEQIVPNGESETLEFKKSTALLNAAAETLCGFLNGKGGKVLIGVTSEKKIVGQHVSDNTLQEIASVLTKFEPHAAVVIDRVVLDNQKEILVLTAIPRKTDVPYCWDGRSYQRVGSVTSKMPQQLYQRLLLERDHSNHRWETGVATGYGVNDLDSEEILRTVRLGIEAGRLPEYQGEGVSQLIERLGLKKSEQILNAAVVLFGKRFLPEYTQCQLRLARFKGIDKSEFIDQKQLIGNTFYLLEEAMIFLRRHLPIAGRVLPDALERKDDVLFPLEALREAMVNAFCHRSYAQPGGAVSVAIFDDRLEIWNDGNLPFGLTPGDLKRDHMSHQRNPLIATIFYNRGLIEKWGRGTQKIIKLCDEVDLPEPEFLEQANSFLVRFLPNKSASEIHKINVNMSIRQNIIYEILLESNFKGLTFAEVKSKFPNPPADRTLRDDFQYLKRQGIINVSGRGKGAVWNIS